jgi:alkylation response protein AidB-like acyl-CoA dehydrogenase
MSCVRDGDDYVLNGEKWWASGAGDPRCKIYIVMVRTGGDDTPKHARHSMILVPADTAGIEKLRPMQVYGQDDAPHGHIHLKFTDVRVPASNLLVGEGKGFEIAQGRLGPGRIHHCMRAIGQAEMALELMCKRSLEREAFGKKLAQLGANYDIIAECRMEIEHGAAAVPEGRLDDGSGRRRRCRPLDQPDQGRGTARGAQGHRRGGADVRRTGHFPGHAAGPHAGPTCARCASPMVPTPCTAARWRAPNSNATRRKRCDLS